jgi:hypothetical protein
MGGHVAKKLCPDLVFVKPNHEKYARYAAQVQKVMKVRTKVLKKKKKKKLLNLYIFWSEMCSASFSGKYNNWNVWFFLHIFIRCTIRN